MTLFSFMTMNAHANDLLEKVKQDFPEAIETHESYSKEDLSNATKRRPQSIQYQSINKDVLILKMMERMSSMQKEIDDLKKTSAHK